MRKSVPEGYKTSSAYSGFSLWADNDASITDDTTPVSSTPVPYNSGAGARELAPFCGIHKVGGLAVQPVHSQTMTPMSSQDSILSTSSVTSATERVMNVNMATFGYGNGSSRKRIHATAEEEAEQDRAPSLHGGPWMRNGRAGEDSWFDGEISPRSFAPAGWENARVMAVPKPRRKKVLSGGGDGGGGNGGVVTGLGVSLAELGQENMAVDDFDEAPFLEYGAGGEEMEVE